MKGNSALGKWGHHPNGDWTWLMWFPPFIKVVINFDHCYYPGIRLYLVDSIHTTAHPAFLGALRLWETCALPFIWWDWITPTPPPLLLYVHQSIYGRVTLAGVNPPTFHLVEMLSRYSLTWISQMNVCSRKLVTSLECLLWSYVLICCNLILRFFLMYLYKNTAWLSSDEKYGVYLYFI